MDAPKDRLQAWKLAHSADLDRLSLRASAWRAEVDHVMDNFSLRAQTGMFMRVPATADSHGFELASDFAVGDWNLELGLQQAALERLAIRSAGMNAAALTMRNALLWPQAELERRGVFVEMRGSLSARSSLTAGLRWDRFEADALRANEPVNMNLPAAASFYRNYYGATELRRSDSGLGALLRVDHRFDDDLQLFAGASRSVRAADSSERYIASTSGAGPTRWIGNPGLKNERHLQLDGGLIWSPGQARYSAVLFVDRVGDYILRDRARGQAGVLLADGATVYRNVDADLRGAELEAEWRLGQVLKLEAQLDYVRGRNRGDRRALAQIAPLSFALRLSSDTAAGEFSARLRGADRQSRVDASASTGSGLDARQTPGWMALDLGWSIEHAAQRLRIGIDNVFDRLYAEHLNRANQDPFNPDPIQVNEPGRSLRIGWEYRF
jgi:iron complex outermembrane receptor protein